VYVIVWEFRAREGREKEFERFYGTRGDWARFFSGGEGFLGTELIRDGRESRRYLTLDRWVSQESHARFRSRHAAEYEALDQRAEELTEFESHLGSFAPVED
jgi:heme-degrading monooxygenase HmoA